MDNQTENNAALKIYAAPLQGFTDFVYRRCFRRVFPGVDKFYIPYVSMKNNGILKKHEKEILPENNAGLNSIPQVLVKDAAEMQFLSEKIRDLGYTEINLNLGCPYPMVTNRGRGAGILPRPDILESILKRFFSTPGLELSVKMRAGLNSPADFENIIPVLNSFPIKEVIFHPRVATRLYKGEIHSEAFLYAQNNLRHPLVFNGDIFSVNDFEKRKAEFPAITRWMIGRGILKNPLLPALIKGWPITVSEKKSMLTEFHRLLLKEYSKTMDNEGNVIHKMQQFWNYFCFNFNNPGKCFRRIRKVKKAEQYRLLAASILNSY